MSDSDDEDIKRAIALSLQDGSSPPAKSPPAAVIDLTSSDDDDDLDAPVHIKGSMSSNKPPQKQDRRVSVVDLSEDEPKAIAIEYEGPRNIHSPIMKSSRVSDSSSKPQPPPMGFSMLSLDRKQMEAERLVRAQQKKKREEELLVSESKESRKRKASISDIFPGSQDGQQVKGKFGEPTQTTRQDIGDPALQSAVSSGSEIKRGAPLIQDSHSLPLRESFSPTSQPSRTEAKVTAPDVLSFKQQQALQASGVQYPDGVVKRTWVKGCPREDDIKIEEVFQKDDLELAVLSTFQIEPEWVSEKLLEKTKVIWILQAKDEKEVS
jgi:hypothetical protein